MGENTQGQQEPPLAPADAELEGLLVFYGPTGGYHDPQVVRILQWCQQVKAALVAADDAGTYDEPYSTDAARAGDELRALRGPR